MSNRGRVALGLLAAGLLGAAPGRLAAQRAYCPEERTFSACRNLELQIFQPPPGGGTTFTIDRADVPRHLTYRVGLAANVAFRLLTVDQDDGRAPEPIVAALHQAELLAAVGLFELLELGAALPVVVVDSARDAGDLSLGRTRSAGLGDLRITVKFPILRGGLALSGRVVASLPTGDDENFAGSGYWTLAPSFVGALRVGRLALAGELGLRMRRGAVVPDASFAQGEQLLVAVGASHPVVPGLDAIAEVHGSVAARFDGVDEGNPLEGDLGLRWRPATGVALELGGGHGLVAGAGAPSPRVFAVVRYASEREPCAAGPEDYDGFDDGDFCADPDNDADGATDARDLCPNDAEDPDGFADDDGCPDADNDADGTADADDRCPLENEDWDGFVDDDGCPDADNDEDGIADLVDGCPMDPETRNEFEDEDGCPDQRGPATITVTDTRILVSQRVYFDFDLDTIRPVSLPLLDQVAEVIGTLPPDRRVRVEGHTDNQGGSEYNLDLSFRRARAVAEYLAARGIPAARLEHVGYGDQHPVAPNDSPEGRALNRRVEFTILEPTDAPAPPPPRASRRRAAPTR